MSLNRASAVPRRRVSAARPGDANGSATIQARRVKTTPASQWSVTAEEQGLRLDRFLATSDRLGSRGRARVALDRGQVFVNEVQASAKDAGSRLNPGDIVRLWMDRPGSARRRTFGALAGQARRLQILYEDETLLVVNKPAGLLAVPLGRGHPSRSAFRLVAEHLGPRGRRTPFVVHRIDRDTSGIVVFAKTAAAQRAIKDQFARRQPERVYWAIVHGSPRPAHGRWRDHLAWDDESLKQTATSAKDPKGVEAISDYRVLETFGEAALVEVRLRTGKRNQIRIQAALRGHALVGERQYAAGRSKRTGPTLVRQALHAHRLSFAHPIDGRQLTFEAPLPRDLVHLLHRLRTRSHKGPTTNH
jgi:23S rRNA pseudouridine1911/1915/1917 synthase